MQFSGAYRGQSVDALARGQADQRAKLSAFGNYAVGRVTSFVPVGSSQQYLSVHIPAKVMPDDLGPD